MCMGGGTGGNMKKYIAVLLLITLTISGCDFRPRVGAPWMQKLMFEGPEGPTMFKVGWRHGCETGVSVTSNAFQRHFYKFNQDAKLARNKVYYTGWKLAYNYCQRYVAQYLRRGLI